MKNVFFIRSAAIDTIDKLVKQINADNNNGVKIYSLIQESSYNSFKEKYPDISFYIKEDGFFNYNTFKKNKNLIRNINKICYDELIIPSSTKEFEGFTEIIKIASIIKNKKILFFNCDGQVSENKKCILEKLFGRSIYNIIEFIFILIIVFFILIKNTIKYPIELIKYKLLNY